MATEQKKDAKNKLESFKQTLHKFLHEENAFTYLFALAEKYTKLKREYIFVALLGFLGLYLVVGYGAGLLVNLLGFLYPAYQSCKAIDSDDKDDDTQWLTYWVVYGAFGILEYFTDLFLSWVPFYFLAKCAFLVWCMMPTANNGSVVIYNRIIAPFVRKHEKTFDEIVSTGTELAKEAGRSGIGALKDAAGKVDLNKLQEVKQAAEEFTSDKAEKQD